MNETEMLEEVTDNGERNDSDDKISANDYTLIREMIQEMEEYNDLIFKESSNILNSVFGLNVTALPAFGMTSDEKFEAMSDEELAEFFEKYEDPEKGAVKFTSREEYMNAIHEIQKLHTMVLTNMEDVKKIKEESGEILNEYLNYLSSDEVKDARRKRLNQMKEMAVSETDELKKAKINRMIQSLEQSDSLIFIFKRMETIGEKEKQSVLDGFFNQKRGEYVINKFNSKIGKFGFDQRLYHYFFNLEEDFLPEKYHPFNNLFLFYYMRFIAYADPYNKEEKLYVQSLTSKIANLVYHKFPTNESEKQFVHLIEKFDDFFIDMADYFIENNTTRPGHPVREEASLKAEMTRKTDLIKTMNKLGITGYDESKSSNELQKYMNEQIKEKTDERNQKIDEPTENVEGENTVVEDYPIESTPTSDAVE